MLAADRMRRRKLVQELGDGQAQWLNGPCCCRDGQCPSDEHNERTVCRLRDQVHLEGLVAIQCISLPLLTLRLTLGSTPERLLLLSKQRLSNPSNHNRKKSRRKRTEQEKTIAQTTCFGASGN
jgi:hypothetical protein